MEQVKHQNTPLRDVTLPHKYKLHDSFCMYGFNSSRGTLLLTFHSGMSGEGVTTSLTGGMKFSHQDLNKSTTVLLPDGYHRPKAMRLLQVKDDVDWIQ